MSMAIEGYWDPFHVEGGCWCPPSRTLAQMRVSGHTPECTQTRAAWARNRAHLSRVDIRRREDEAAGRLLREAAEEALRTRK